MTRTALVNYHIHAPERQAYHIDAGGVVGQIISPEHAVTEVQLTDVRTNAGVTFERDSVAFLSAASTVSAFGQVRTWQDAYNSELTTLLTREIDATDVIVFDHTLRIDDPNAKRKPARNVHSDYSPEGAQARLIDILVRPKPLNGPTHTTALSTCGVRWRPRSTRPLWALCGPPALRKTTGFCWT